MRRLVSDVVKGLSVAAAVLITLPSHAGGPFLSLGVPATAPLLKLGVGSDRLLMATVLDLDRNHHAVLILRTERGDYVLDNLIDEIKYWGDTGYIFLRIQLPLDKKQWRSVF